MMVDKEKNTTNEALAELYEQSISDIKEGEILKGTIVQIGEKDILVDIGYKSEGLIHKSEVSDPEELKVGDKIDIFLESKENDHGMVVVSHEKARKFKGWQDIVDNYKEGDSIEGKVARKVRGGFMVDVGLEAFLPASLASMQDVGGADNLVGNRYKFKIVKINVARKNIVVSRKEIVEESLEKVYLEKEEDLAKKAGEKFLSRLNSLPLEKKKARLFSFLSRQGFPSEMCVQTTQKLVNEE